MKLTSQKHLFNLRDDEHYLNCAYKAPLLKSAEEIGIQAILKERNPSDISAEDFFDDTSVAKELFGKIVNCPSSRVAIIPSTSYGLSAALANINPSTRQNAITVQQEFPSAYFSLQRWCDDHTVQLNIVQPLNDEIWQPKEWTDRIIEAISSDTAVVVISSIHWMTGLKFDLKTIGAKCKELGVAFLVDGTQSVGASPMDVDEYNIDALICATYKWLYGRYSVSFAYYGERFDKGRPLEESWMNRTNAVDFGRLTEYDLNYKSHAGRYNVGQSSNFILMPMVIEGFKQILKWEVSHMQDYSSNLADLFLLFLRNNDVDTSSMIHYSQHLFGLKLPTSVDNTLLKHNLVEDKIKVSLRGEYIRVALSVFNTEEDVNALIHCIERSKIL